MRENLHKERMKRLKVNDQMWRKRDDEGVGGEEVRVDGGGWRSEEKKNERESEDW